MKEYRITIVTQETQEYVTEYRENFDSYEEAAEDAQHEVRGAQVDTGEYCEAIIEEIDY